MDANEAAKINLKIYISGLRRVRDKLARYGYSDNILEIDILDNVIGYLGRTVPLPETSLNKEGH